MTGQTPGTPTNQATNNLQQLNLRDNPIAFIKKNSNFLEISDRLKTVCLHGVDIFVTFSHRRKFWCQWNHWGAAGCCVDYQFWTFHHHQHYIALIRFAGSRFVIALLYVDILNTTHHTTPHHTVCVRNEERQEKWEQVVIVTVRVTTGPTTSLFCFLTNSKINPVFSQQDSRSWLPLSLLTDEIIFSSQDGCKAWLDGPQRLIAILILSWAWESSLLFPAFSCQCDVWPSYLISELEVSVSAS